ncbi:hypothetical protein Pmar_PMAR029071 [Perkinsus marinus ATCC 50983]|uniref:Uncharacterized protein n=1 Tax=Perkinsus marinus (strain ATCC 50983 / TXsc) TaxID=423536 RepID=C5LFT1_PERM5|nr:hypothetical protein Pmar_PMAR029071 [Perkinsus marinus ATCC 50983]EER04410.1 hypothetical protein Pmar_PMAR029071 [Perkinsus marinus ATCC 50983]|eukprot:XP_002772594.1 hypothetical protein Pmar_PMAR029071 [Perkinsus marinus ATCC 50983]
MPSVSTWLIAAQALNITAAQDVGRYVYQNGAYRITYDVNEEHQVKFTFWVPPPPGTWSPDGFIYTFPIGPGEEFTHGPYSLSELGSSTYAIDFDGAKASARDWYKSIERLLLRNSVIHHDPNVPYGGIQSGDLTVLTYTSGDSISTSFRDEDIDLMRVGGELTPGEYVFEDDEAPHFEISYVIRLDGIVGVQIACGGTPTTRFPFKLVRRGEGLPYVHYLLEPVGRYTLEDLRQQVRYVCQRQDLVPSDGSHVVFATKNTVYVELGGVRFGLTKVE